MVESSAIETACLQLLDAVAKEEGWVGPTYWNPQSRLYRNMIVGLHHAARGLLISTITQSPDVPNHDSPYNTFHMRMVTGTKELMAHMSGTYPPERIYRDCKEWIQETRDKLKASVFGVSDEEMDAKIQQFLTVIAKQLGVSDKG